MAPLTAPRGARCRPATGRQAGELRVVATREGAGSGGEHPHPVEPEEMERGGGLNGYVDDVYSTR